ncbi:MAG: hypothetical protein KME22_08795 [Hassallia sp. WJT32-NPBG1]|nr:hypothetical protein [Hassallia sp. WJT32-NPBG1]
MLYVIFRLGNGKDLVKCKLCDRALHLQRNSDVLAGWMAAIAWISG